METILTELGLTGAKQTTLQHKDGVHVMRLQKDHESYILKHFEKQEHTREITNYKLLHALGIATLKVIQTLDHALLLEDLETSPRFRLAAEKDVKDPATCRLIAAWYRALHDKGRAVVHTLALYDENDLFTRHNLEEIRQRSATEHLAIWPLLDQHFESLRAAIDARDRTLTYNDFYYTNLAVARDGSSALMFDYNLLGKGTVHSDIRNVCWDFSPACRQAFLEAYGPLEKGNEALEELVSFMVTLHVAYQREVFPSWGQEALDTLHAYDEKKLQYALKRIV